MSEHTPGPWIEFADQGKTVAILPAMRGGEVCAFSSPPSDADARLIAAAPDMLTALKNIVYGTADEMRSARAAIAKAEGRS